MPRHIPLPLGLSCLCLLVVVAGHARADSAKQTAIAPPGRNAAERGLRFLQQDAAKWRKERQCSTCHHGTMTVWALSEANNQGYDVSAEALTDAAKWTKDRLLD